LSQRTFTIFVVMALVTTFATTPLTSALFPPWYQKKLAAWKRGEIDWDGNRLHQNDSSDSSGDAPFDKREASEIGKLLICLRLDSLPSLFTFVALLGGGRSTTLPAKTHPSKTSKAAGDETNYGALQAASSEKRPLQVHGLRMLELTERLSSVMKDSEADEWSSRDPVVNAFHTFGQLNNVAVSGEVQLVPEGSYASELCERASERLSDLILLPWSETGSTSELTALGFTDSAPSTFNNSTYNSFVSSLLATAPCNTAIFVNNGFGARARKEVRGLSRTPTNLSLRSAGMHATAPLVDLSHHIFFPYSGSLHDRVALRFVLRLARNSNVTATILLVNGSDGSIAESVNISEEINVKDKTRVTHGTEIVHEQGRVFFNAMRDSLPSELQSRVVFNSVETQQPLHEIVERARAEIGQLSSNAGDLVIVGRNQRCGTDGDIKHTLGAWAESMIQGSVNASVMVVQAGGRDVGRL